MRNNNASPTDGKGQTVSVGSTALLGASDAKLTANLMLKAEMFDYLCWLEDFCVFRAAALGGKAGDYLVTASDGTTCWGKTYAEAVRVAMEHDKDLQDATSPNPSLGASAEQHNGGAR